MAFTTSELKTIISSTTIDRLSKLNLMLRLVDRRWQAEAQGTYEVRVPVFDSQIADNISVTTPARNADWGTATEDGISYRTIVPDMQHEAQRFIQWRDEAELPLNILVQTGTILASVLDKALDADIFAQFIAGVPGSSGASTAMNTTYLGDGVTVDVAGKEAMEAGKAVYEYIADEFELKAYDAGFGPDSETPFARWVVMNPQVFQALRRYMLSQKYNEQLSLSIIQTGDVLGTSRTLRAVINGVEVHVTSNVPKHQTGGNDTHWNVLAGTNRALTYITKPALVQAFSPEENQVSTKPGWLFRERMPFGRMMIDNRTAHLLRVPIG